MPKYRVAFDGKWQEDFDDEAEAVAWAKSADAPVFFARMLPKLACGQRMRLRSLALRRPGRSTLSNAHPPVRRAPQGRRDPHGDAPRPAPHRRDPGAHRRRPVHIVAARLGDDPRTVLATYASLLPQSDEIAAERVAAALAHGS